MKGGGGQQQQSGPELTFFLILLVVAGGAALAWYHRHADIVAFCYRIRLFELQLINMFVDSFGDFMRAIGIPVTDLVALDQSIDYLQNVLYNEVDWQEFSLNMHKTGLFMVYPVMTLSFAGTVYLMFVRSLTRYRNTYTMRTLSQLEVQNWPMISPVLDMDLVREDINKGPWRMTETPLLFSERYSLIEAIYKDGKHVAKLKRQKAFAVLAIQMGPLWNGLEDLPAYVRALFAVFAAKAENDNKGARALLSQIAKSSRSGKLNFGGTQELLIRHVRSIKVGRAVGPHAFQLTVMASMLELARTDGVLATAEFLWLKPLDRRLWYMLNCVGRQTPFTEVSGPFAHWIVEKRLRRPLKVPMVSEAVDALDVSLSEFIYNPEDQ